MLRNQVDVIQRPARDAEASGPTEARYCPRWPGLHKRPPPPAAPDHSPRTRALARGPGPPPRGRTRASTGGGKRRHTGLVLEMARDKNGLGLPPHPRRDGPGRGYKLARRRCGRILKVAGIDPAPRRTGRTGAAFLAGQARRLAPTSSRVDTVFSAALYVLFS